MRIDWEEFWVYFFCWPILLALIIIVFVIQLFGYIFAILGLIPATMFWLVFDRHRDNFPNTIKMMYEKFEDWGYDDYY